MQAILRTVLPIQMDGGIWQIIEFQHVKPGKGAAFVRTKLKNIVSGGVVVKAHSDQQKSLRQHTSTREITSIYTKMVTFTTSWIWNHTSRSHLTLIQ